VQKKNEIIPELYEEENASQSQASMTGKKTGQLNQKTLDPVRATGTGKLEGPRVMQVYNHID